MRKWADFLVDMHILVERVSQNGLPFFFWVLFHM